MAGGIHMDDSELRNLGLDLSRARKRVQFNASKAVRRGAAIVDAEMVVDASGHRRLKHLPSTVSHEMLAPLEAEIGLEYKGQGKLAHIIVYGSVNNGPVYDHTAGLRRAAPAIDKILADAAEESVFGARGDTQ